MKSDRRRKIVGRELVAASSPQLLREIPRPTGPPRLARRLLSAGPKGDSILATIRLGTVEGDDSVVFQENEQLEPIGFQVTETDEEIDLTADLSGFDEDDIEVVFDQGTLTITGYHEEDEVEDEEDEDEVEDAEAHIGFSDTLALPKGIGPEQIAADMDDGILTIVIHKSAPPAGGADA